MLDWEGCACTQFCLWLGLVYLLLCFVFWLSLELVPRYCNNIYSNSVLFEVRNVVTSLLGLVIISHLSPKGLGRFTDSIHQNDITGPILPVPLRANRLDWIGLQEYALANLDRISWDGRSVPRLLHSPEHDDEKSAPAAAPSLVKLVPMTRSTIPLSEKRYTMRKERWTSYSPTLKWWRALPPEHGHHGGRQFFGEQFITLWLVFHWIGGSFSLYAVRRSHLIPEWRSDGNVHADPRRRWPSRSQRYVFYFSVRATVLARDGFGFQEHNMWFHFL
jgi:hypothetical protein